MGYVEGKGLGKNEQGRVDIVESSKQRGRRGLGLQLAGLEANEDAKWILDEEEVRNSLVLIPLKIQSVQDMFIEYAKADIIASSCNV